MPGCSQCHVLEVVLSVDLVKDIEIRALTSHKDPRGAANVPPTCNATHFHLGGGYSGGCSECISKKPTVCTGNHCTTSPEHTLTHPPTAPPSRCPTPVPPTPLPTLQQHHPYTHHITTPPLYPLYNNNTPTSSSCLSLTFSTVVLNHSQSIRRLDGWPLRLSMRAVWMVQLG